MIVGNNGKPILAAGGVSYRSDMTFRFRGAEFVQVSVRIFF